MAVILVADDEEMVRTLVATILRSEGHEVLTAANGLEAVALFRSYWKRIKLVITDLKMPVMDGHELIKIVREMQPTAHIVCMTGFAENIPEDVACIAKPFGPGKLLDLVKQELAPT